MLRRCEKLWITYNLYLNSSWFCRFILRGKVPRVIGSMRFSNVETSLGNISDLIRSRPGASYRIATKGTVDGEA
jgi:hypothetical protein